MGCHPWRAIVLSVVLPLITLVIGDIDDTTARVYTVVVDSIVDTVC